MTEIIRKVPTLVLEPTESELDKVTKAIGIKNLYRAYLYNPLISGSLGNFLNSQPPNIDAQKFKQVVIPIRLDCEEVINKAKEYLAEDGVIIKDEY